MSTEITTHHNPDYIITSISVNNSGYLTVTGHTPHQIDLTIDITVTNPEVLKTSDNPIEVVSKMLENNLPDWCTTAMAHQALQEKYPERFL